MESHFLLTPGDCLYEGFQNYSPSNKEFSPADLDSHDDVREDAVKTMYVFFKKMADISNLNLIRNVDYLARKSKLNYSEFR